MTVYGYYKDEETDICGLDKSIIRHELVEYFCDNNIPKYRELLYNAAFFAEKDPYDQLRIFWGNCKDLFYKILSQRLTTIDEYYMSFVKQEMLKNNKPSEIGLIDLPNDSPFPECCVKDWAICVIKEDFYRDKNKIEY
jgi:hypothetical protein